MVIYVLKSYITLFFMFLGVAATSQLTLIIFGAFGDIDLIKYAKSLIKYAAVKEFYFGVCLKI
jgi:hypothetical protein